MRKIDKMMAEAAWRSEQEGLIANIAKRGAEVLYEGKAAKMPGSYLESEIKRLEEEYKNRPLKEKIISGIGTALGTHAETDLEIEIRVYREETERRKAY